MSSKRKQLQDNRHWKDYNVCTKLLCFERYFYISSLKLSMADHNKAKLKQQLL